MDANVQQAYEGLWMKIRKVTDKVVQVTEVLEGRVCISRQYSCSAQNDCSRENAEDRHPPQRKSGCNNREVDEDEKREEEKGPNSPEGSVGQRIFAKNLIDRTARRLVFFG